MHRNPIFLPILKKTVLTALFPLLMFLVMLLITMNNPRAYANSTYIFLTSDLIRQVLVGTSLTTCVALAIWLQLKNGRFDFSGGASMILTAIIAGNIGKQTGSPYIAFAVAIGTAVLLSLVTAVLYIWGRVPIIISTIGTTLLYESLTYIFFNGEGLRGFYSETGLSIFGRLPGIFLPFGLSVAIFYLYSYGTVQGRKGKILANNQNAGVHIGINEKRDVLAAYLVTGLLIGLAAIIYVSQNDIAPKSGLSTSGILFSYIVPVFMGIFIGSITVDVLGIVIAAVGMEIMNYGLSCINLGAGGWQQIIMGVFMLAFYAFSAQSHKLTTWKNRLMNKKINADVQ